MELRMLALLLMYAIVTPLEADQGQGRNRDGNWWTSLPSSGSDVALNLSINSWYITGSMDGAIGVANNLVFQAGIEALDEKAEKVRIDYLRTINRYFAGGRATQGERIDGLDAFYADFRNRNILVGHAIGIVLHQIAGYPQKVVVDGMIEVLRRNATSR